MTLFLTIFAEDVLPVLLVAAVGWLLARRTGVAVTTLSRVTFYALVPCLAFNSLVTSTLGADQMWRMAAFTVTLILGIGLIAWLVTRGLGLDRATVAGFLLVVMFSNGGNFGLPVTLFAFGPPGLARATIYFVTSSALVYTLGVLIASGGRQSPAGAIREVLGVPAIYGVLAAIVVMLVGVTVPAPVMRPIQLLAGAALPCMILVLGMQLTRIGRPDRPGVIGLAVLLSLVVAPLLGLGLAAVLGLDGPSRQAAVIEAAMPGAVVNTILASEYRVAPAFVTSAVFVSTLLSPLTVTLLIAHLT